MGNLNLTIERVTATDSSQWRACLEIYQTSFPDWEREPIDVITERVQQGRYILLAGIGRQAQVVGFSLLDVVAELNCVVLTFLAITKSERGKGYGTVLCQEVIRYFKHEIAVDWLLVEAEERQAVFYRRLDFKALDLDYKVPKFGESGSAAMYLMAMSADEGVCEIPGSLMASVIKLMFIEGYQLSEHDSRLSEQIALIPERVKLMNV